MRGNFLIRSLGNGSLWLYFQLIEKAAIFVMAREIDKERRNCSILLGTGLAYKIDAILQRGKRKSSFCICNGTAVRLPCEKGGNLLGSLVRFPGLWGYFSTEKSLSITGCPLVILPTWKISNTTPVRSVPRSFSRIVRMLSSCA